MMFRFKNLVLGSLVLSLTYSVNYNNLLISGAFAQTAPSTNSNTDTLFQQGLQQYRLGQYPQALSTYQRVLENYKQVNDQPKIAQTLNNIGEVYLGLDQYDKALEVLQAALNTRRQLKDKTGEGETLDNIGWVYYYKEQYDEALKVLQQALAIRQSVKDKAGEAKTISRIANVYIYIPNQAKQALPLLNQALQIQQDIGDKFQAGITLSGFVAAYRKLEDNPRALESAQRALSWNREVKNRASEGRILAVIGSIYMIQNKQDQALQYFNQALPIVRESGMRALESQILMLSGYINYSQKQYDRAIDLQQQSLVIARQNKLRPRELEALESLLYTYQTRALDYTRKGLTSQAKADLSKIIELSQSALILARELKKPLSESNALGAQGLAYKELGDQNKAITILEQALNIARKNRSLNEETTILNHLADIYIRQGNNRKLIETNLRQVEISKEQNDIRGLGFSLLALGSNYNVVGLYPKAIESFQQILTIISKIDKAKLPPSLQDSPQLLEFNALIGLSITYDNLGENNKALESAEQALKRAQAFGKRNFEVDALLRLASLYSLSYKNYSKSAELSQQALTIARQIKEPSLEIKALQYLTDAYIKQGNYTQAIDSANQILASAKDKENPNFENTALGLLYKIYNQQGNYQKAAATADSRLVLAKQLKIRYYEMAALIDVSESYLSLGDTTKALEAANQSLAIAEESNSYGSKAIALLIVARVYQNQGQYEQAIPLVQKSLELSRNSKNYFGEVTAYSTLSNIHTALGDFQKVIQYTEPGIALARRTNNRKGEAELLIDAGNAYRVLGNYPTSKNYIDQALKIARELKSPQLESNALNNLAYYYSALNDYQQGLNFAQQSLKIAESLKSPPALISPQFNLGDIYTSLGDYNKASSYYQQALTTAQQLKNRFSESNALLSIAAIHFAQGDGVKTVELAQQSLKISQSIKYPLLEAFARRMLSVGYGQSGNDSSAMQEAQAFLTFAQKNQNPVWQKLANALLGDLHQKFGRPKNAISSYQAALAIKTDTQASGNDWGIYAGLGKSYVALNQPNEAIKHYRQAINQIESVRRNIQGLPQELQSSYLLATVDFDKVKRADIYRQYADLLLKLGRTAEAQQVLELLKYQEVQDYLRAAKGVDSTAKNQIIALGKELSDLETIPRDKRNNKQQQRVIELRKTQEKLLQEYGEFFKNPEVTKRIEELRQITGGENFDPQKQARRLQDNLKRLQQDAVIVYPLVLPDRLELVLVTPYTSLVHRTVKVSEAELNKTIEDFRKDLQSPSSDAKVNANKLYQLLIKPLENDLAQAKTKTIIFAPDGKLRYVPLAALYDGKQWLVERFGINNITALSLMDLNTKPQTKKQVLTAAFTDTNRSVTVPLGGAKETFRGLKHAAKEVDGIVAEIPGSTKLINNQFNQDIVYQMNDYSIVHLATHAAFVDGKPEDSVILLGNGQYVTLRDVKSWNLPNVDLIVLSACETGLGGFGDGREILGFGYRMQEIGAKAAIASLWQVDDPSTAQLMQHFYNNLEKAPITKAEALRQAQLSMLNGKSNQESSDKRGLEIIPPKNPGAKVNVGYAHPYYWAPFILIGNGL